MTAVQRTPRTGAPRRSGNGHRHRVQLAGGLLALVAAFGGSTATAAAGSSPRVSSTQDLAVVLTTHRAYRSPSTSAPIVASVSSQRPITGAQTTLPVIGQANGPGVTRWLKVMLPGRPDGLTGWITREGTRGLVTNWDVVVNRSTRRVRVFFHRRLRRSFQAVVGKPSTPTPRGRFFVEETVRMPSGEAGGPFALALSARSNVLQEFAGGPGQIGIHGRDNLGGALGQAVSHGCVRLDTASITWLAARIGPGVPVTIYG